MSLNQQNVNFKAEKAEAYVYEYKPRSRLSKESGFAPYVCE